MTNRTRLKLAVIASIYFGITTWAAMFTHNNAVALVAITSIAPLLTVYIWGETKRPSDDKNNTIVFDNSKEIK